MKDGALPDVDEMLAYGVSNAEGIYRDIRKAGYTGKLSILRAYIRPKRKLRPSAGTGRYETAPGQQLQHGWAERLVTMAGSVRRFTSLAVNALGCSRGLHVVRMPCCDAEHTYEAVILAFEAFDGVSATLLVNTQKSAALN